MCRFISVLLMAGLFVCSPAALAQISLVQVTSCGPATFPGTSCTIPATGSGHLIVVAWASNDGGGATTIASITDSAADTYSEAPGARAVDSAAYTMIDLWYAQNSNSGATTVTITPNPTGTQGTAVIWEFAGVGTGAPVDQVAILNSQPATSTPSGAPVSTTVAAEVVISVANVQGSVSGMAAGNSFTSDYTANGDGWAHLLTSATGTYTAQWNNGGSGTYASSTASFRAASSYSACDLNQEGVVNIVDVELATVDVLDFEDNASACAAPFGQCSIPFVQAVLAAAMGGACALPAAISFGNVTVGSSSSQTITLTGGGTSSTTISQATASGTGFSISGPTLPLTLSVGQTASFTVTFIPKTTGSASGSLTVGNALNTPANVTLSGTGIGTLPVLGVAPSSISFGNVLIGSSSTQVVTLTGTGTVTISQATVTGAGFSISGPSLPLTLSAEQNTASFNVTFTPTRGASVTGSVTFVSNAQGSPFIETLSGTGVHNVVLSWTGTTSNASYNVYRIASSNSTAPATGYSSVGSVTATAPACSSTGGSQQCTYTDASVQAGQSYWYYVTAVAGGVESAPSTAVQALVPTP